MRLYYISLSARKNVRINPIKMQEIKKKLLKMVESLSDTRVLTILAFGLVAVLVTWSGIRVVQTNYELEKKIAVAKQKNDIAILENQNLELKNKYYESNQYLELAARRQFGKAAAGEKLYIVPDSVAMAKTSDNPDQKKSPQAQNEKTNKYTSNLQAWQDFFLGSSE